MATVVVAEDDPGILELVAEVLEEEGFQVVRSMGADEDALQKIEHYQPEVVVLDYQLPGLTGVEIVRRLREGSGAAAMRIVAMTAASRAQRVCAAMQADACLAKPFTIEDLVAAVQHTGHRQSP